MGMKTVEERLKLLSFARVDGIAARDILHFSELNPEQKLVYVLSTLNEAAKTSKALVEVCLILAQEYQAWKAAPVEQVRQQQQ
jgi:hypothetical protein